MRVLCEWGGKERGCSGWFGYGMDEWLTNPVRVGDDRVPGVRKSLVIISFV